MLHWILVDGCDQFSHRHLYSCNIKIGQAYAKTYWTRFRVLKKISNIPSHNVASNWTMSADTTYYIQFCSDPLTNNSDSRDHTKIMSFKLYLGQKF